MGFDDFDKDFDKMSNHIIRMQWVVVCFGIMFTVAMLGGVGFLAYLLLRYFGVI